jgi:hypothetical protein
VETDLAWRALIQAPAMTVVLGLDSALRPLVAPPGDDLLDRGIVRLVDGIVHTGATVLIASRRAKPAVEVLRRKLPAATWLAEAGAWRFDGAWSATTTWDSLEAWLRERLPAGPLMMIGDDLALDRFQPIAPFEIAFTSDANDPRVTRRRVPGAAAVRAFLWWLVEVRCDSQRPIQHR